MATFVLVHGGSHGGWCRKKVAPLLRAGGHEVYAPTLTGLGERAHLLSLEVGLDSLSPRPHGGTDRAGGHAPFRGLPRALTMNTDVILRD